MNKEITAVARALKWGGFAAYGLKPIGLASQALVLRVVSASNLSWFSRYASAKPLTPPPERKRKSRRDQHVLQIFIAVLLAGLGTWGLCPPTCPTRPTCPT